MDVVVSEAGSNSNNVTTAASSVNVDQKGSKKRNLTLDLNAKLGSGTGNLLAVPPTSNPDLSKASPGFVLTSPDVQMLQLASPELEKFIIQGLMGQNIQTPTPTQLVFPKTVTEEQESYAKGFVDALNALHRTGIGGGMAYNYNVNPNNTANITAFPINNVNGQQLFPQFFAVPQQQFQLQQQNPNQNQVSVPTSGLLQLQQAPQAKPEPYSPPMSPSMSESDHQTVPSDRASTKSSNSSTGATTNNASPVNMGDQSKMKVERKRERNRLAAAKCRQRKLERISQLEERVKELKGENSALADTATQLREDLGRLKQELLHHVSSGCSVSVSSQLMQTLQNLQMQVD